MCTFATGMFLIAMNRKFIALFFFALLLPFAAAAQQPPVQEGYVKTIGRPDKPGVMLENVHIRVRGSVNATNTSSSGEFAIPMPDKKAGDEFVLMSVQKNGYELKDKSLIGRPLVFSQSVRIEILMVDLQQLAADKMRIEENAYRVAENNYQSKLRQIELQKEKHEITAEKYRQELQQLQDSYEKYLSLIGDMADRYARTDYDRLDDTDREINICIENGDFDKADSLIHSVFDPETVLERNRAAKEEIRQRIALAQQTIDKALADREAILLDMEYARKVVLLCDNLAAEYVAQGDSEKALSCWKQALEIERILYGTDSDAAERRILQINEWNP